MIEIIKMKDLLITIYDLNILEQPMKLSDLQKEWYQRLKDDGFEDIEHFDQNGNPQDWLKHNHKFAPEVAGTVPQTEPETLFQENRDYYIAAEHALLTAVFECGLDREIWKQHASGQSLRQIAKSVGFSHVKVLRIINKYKQSILNL